MQQPAWATAKAFAEAGDIAYWSPAQQFAVYYHQDGESIPSPGIILIARVGAGAEAFNVPGAVKVRFAAANEKGT